MARREESQEDGGVVQVPVKGAGGEDRGQLALEVKRLGGRIRYPLLKEAAVMYAANQRVGTHETKTRGQLAGSNKKPWRQKGTGRARAGTRKSPLWRGGGTVFGPHPRDYSYAIHKKTRRLAVQSALLAKFLDGQVLVVDELRVEAPKTKSVARVLGALGVRGSCLIATAGHDQNLVLSARNIPGVLVSPVKEMNALDILKARTVLLTREAFDALARAPEGGRTEGARSRGDDEAPGSGEEKA